MEKSSEKHLSQSRNAIFSLTAYFTGEHREIFRRGGIVLVEAKREVKVKDTEAHDQTTHDQEVSYIISYREYHAKLLCLMAHARHTSDTQDDTSVS